MNRLAVAKPASWFRAVVHHRELDLSIRGDMTVLRLQAPCRGSSVQYLASCMDALRVNAHDDHLVSSSSDKVTLALPDIQAKALLNDVRRLGGLQSYQSDFSLVTVSSNWHQFVNYDDADIVKIVGNRLYVLTPSDKIDNIFQL